MIELRAADDDDKMAGLVESDGVTSYPIIFMSFITILNVIVMKPCERTRVTTTYNDDKQRLNVTVMKCCERTRVTKTHNDDKQRLNVTTMKPCKRTCVTTTHKALL